MLFRSLHDAQRQHFTCLKTLAEDLCKHLPTRLVLGGLHVMPESIVLGAHLAPEFLIAVQSISGNTAGRSAYFNRSRMPFPLHCTLVRFRSDMNADQKARLRTFDAEFRKRSMGEFTLQRLSVLLMRKRPYRDPDELMIDIIARHPRIPSTLVTDHMPSQQIGHPVTHLRSEVMMTPEAPGRHSTKSVGSQEGVESASVSPVKKHVFISHCRENADEVMHLRDDLLASGERSWWDQDILPGQDWKFEIRRAMREAYAVILCLSSESAGRVRSGLYPEAADAVAAYREYTPGSIFLIPVRLSRCDIPQIEIDGTRTLDRLQYVDLFPDPKRAAGLDSLIAALRACAHHP